MSRFRAAFCAVLFHVCLLSLYIPHALSQGSLLPLPEDKPARNLSFPALSPDAKTLCFTYLGDLWTVPTSGGMATRLTVHEALDGYARWSPDGKWIAFASDRFNRAGTSGAEQTNYDIFIIPSTGGTARQITYNTSNDFPTDWSPDGSKILFTSIRGTDRFQQYSIDVKTGVVKTLTKDDMFLRYGVYSPDGTTIAYNRAGGTAPWWRPRFHGSANFDIYTKNLKTGKITRVTDYDGADLFPQYSRDGKTIYYASDRLTPGTPNVLASPAVGGKPSLVTKHKGDAVRWITVSRDGTQIAYMYAGDLYTVATTPNAEPKKLNIYAPSDDKQNNSIRLNLTNGATEVEVSPDGKTLALVVRGELWTIPADRGGDATRLTENPANDYDIVWSPDSKKLAFVSDRRGQFDIFTLDVATKEVKPISTDPNDESNPHFSPDGKFIAFLRSGAQGGIYIAAADGTGTPRRVAASKGNNLFGNGIESFSWSPDGQWIAFSRNDALGTNDIYVVPTTGPGGTETNVTYYPGDNLQPQWTKDGKYITFLSTRERDGGADLYALPLQKEKADPDPASATPTAGITPGTVKFDFDDIENRAKRLTTQGSGGYQITPDGKNIIFQSAVGGPPDFFVVPVSGGQVRRLTTTGEATSAPRFGSDSSKFYALGAGGTVKVIALGGPAQTIAWSARMEFDRRAEIAQAFNEFWRRMNVAFYDPNLHGTDWVEVRKRYEPLLPYIGTKEEFANFLSMMVGELNASHSEIGPAPGQPGATTADLGMTFDEDYAGPGLKVTEYMPKGPNDDLGPKVKVGEYILAIDGQDVSWNESMYKTLLDKAGKTVELTVNATPTKEGARVVKIKPITPAQWNELHYENDVRESRAQVEKLSGGRLGYIHIQAMNVPSLRKMERELWGKVREKDGLVLDLRGNGGGNTHDQILGQLSRMAYGYDQPRDGMRATQPVRHFDKPIILLINQNSASDAEIFPYGFRQLKLGKIVGMPTPGYIIGTYPGTLQDGTSYRIPMVGWFTLDGKDMENNGVKPDIIVEMTPDDIAARRDRQLEVAVETLLKDLPRKATDSRTAKTTGRK